VHAPPPGTENAYGPNILRSVTRHPARVYPDSGRSTGRRLDVEDVTAGRWLDVNSAAEELGVSTDAVRKRISRGTLRSDRKDGAVRVWLDDGGTKAGREAQVDDGALVEVLREQAEYLRGQLAEEREARRRADTIIAQLTQANATLAARVPELEAPQEHLQEHSEAAETVEEAPSEAGAEPHSAAGEAREQLGVERARREAAETTMREGMSEERRRREEAEWERDDLRRELHARGRQQEAHEAAEVQQGRGQPQSAASGPQGGAQPRPWWRRIIRR
jgi:chromosome segregation ATPase